MKSFIAALLSFLMALSSFFGLTDKTAAEKLNGILSSEDCVAVIVELEEESLLDSVSGSSERRELLSSYLQSEQYEKIEQAQEKLRQLIEKTVSAADFNNSFSYSFVLNGFSLVVPYKYISTIEQLPGVKSVSVAARYSQPDDEKETEETFDSKFDYNRFTGVLEAQEKGYTGKLSLIHI